MRRFQARTGKDPAGNARLIVSVPWVMTGFTWNTWSDINSLREAEIRKACVLLPLPDFLFHYFACFTYVFFEEKRLDRTNGSHTSRFFLLYLNILCWIQSQTQMVSLALMGTIHMAYWLQQPNSRSHSFCLLFLLFSHFLRSLFFLGNLSNVHSSQIQTR